MSEPEQHRPGRRLRLDRMRKRAEDAGALPLCDLAGVVCKNSTRGHWHVYLGRGWMSAAEARAELGIEPADA